jgi:hypothetical protein
MIDRAAVQQGIGSSRGGRECGNDGGAGDVPLRDG